MERLRIHPKFNFHTGDWNIQRVETLYENGMILSLKPTQEVRLCQDGETSYVIKKYFSQTVFQSIRELLGKARSDKSFDSAQTLQALKIPVPKHHMIAKKIVLGQSVSYLVMENVPGIPLIQFLQSGNFDNLPKDAEQHIIDIVTSLHGAGIAHGDLHTRNLIIANDGSVSLIDLDNIEKSPARIPRDIRRLHQALVDHPNPMQHLKSYLANKLETAPGAH